MYVHKQNSGDQKCLRKALKLANWELFLASIIANRRVFFNPRIESTADWPKIIVRLILKPFNNKKTNKTFSQNCFTENFQIIWEMMNFAPIWPLPQLKAGFRKIYKKTILEIFCLNLMMMRWDWDEKSFDGLGSGCDPWDDLILSRKFRWNLKTAIRRTKFVQFFYL